MGDPEVKAEDWENACHELIWEAGRQDLFDAIAKRALELRDERAANKRAVPADEIVGYIYNTEGPMPSREQMRQKIEADPDIPGAI